METSLLSVLSKIIVTQGVPTILVLFVCFLVYKLLFFEVINNKGEKVHTNILQTILKSFERLVIAVESLGTDFRSHDVRANAMKEDIAELKEGQRCSEHLQALQEIRLEMAKEKTLKELDFKISKKK